MQDSQNNITTYSIFNLDNKENIETNMQIEEIQENKDEKEDSKIDEIKLDDNEKEEESKKEPKEKRRVRGPNKCYRIIDEFFTDSKRVKIISLNKEDMNLNKNNNNNEEEERKIRKRIKVINMLNAFDEFLHYVESKVNVNYYNKYILPIIKNYKEFYIEKDKEYKENKNSILNNNIEDENLIRKKKIYGLENMLEIPEIVNEFMKFIYNKDIFNTDEDKIELIEIIYIFCAWLKQNHYSSYNAEYLLKEEE
jgi:hypothetical protein